jgi:hypothetical protein
MPVYYVQKIPSTTYCSTLVAKIRRLGLIAIVVYMLYAYTYIIYVFSKDSIKCLECTQKSVPYNRNFLKADFDRLLDKKLKLEAA